MSEIPVTPSPEVIVKRHKRWRVVKGLLLTAIIFISGGACGWGVSSLWGRHHQPMGMMPEPRIDYLVKQESEQLLLTAEQTKKLQDVYKKRFDALKKIREDSWPKYKTEYDGLRSDVENILTKEQFDEWNKRFDAARNQMMPPPPPPPRNGGPPGGGPPGMDMREGGPRGPGPGMGGPGIGGPGMGAPGMGGPPEGGPRDGGPPPPR